MPSGAAFGEWCIEPIDERCKAEEGLPVAPTRRLRCDSDCERRGSEPEEDDEEEEEADTEPAPSEEGARGVRGELEATRLLSSAALSPRPTADSLRCMSGSDEAKSSARLDSSACS